MKLGEILENSFNLPWKNRFLIFYGALIALFAGGYGLSSNANYTISSEELTNKFAWLSDEKVVLGVSILVIILAIAGFVISMWANAAIINATFLIQNKKKVDRKIAGKIGKSKLYKLIVLNFFLPILIVLALLVIGAPLVYLFVKMPQPAGLVTGVIVGSLIVLILIAALVYLGLTWALAVRFIVIEDNKVMEALKSGLNLIRKRFWRTFGFAILFGLVAGAGSAVASLPLILLGGSAFYAFSQNSISVASGLAILTLLYYVIYLAIVGYFQAFSQVGWTFWWQRLKTEKVAVSAPVASKENKKTAGKAATKRTK